MSTTGRRRMLGAIAATVSVAMWERYGPSDPRIGIVGWVIVGGLWIFWLAEPALSKFQRSRRRRTSALGLEHEIAESSRKPRFVPVRVFVEKRTLIAVGASAPHAEIYCANVNFRNDPIAPYPEAEAHSMLAEISFRYRGQVVVKIENGRWGDTDQPAVRKAKDPFGSLIDLNTVPFRIGETHELNVAVKHPYHPHMFAFDNSTFNYQNWENPAHKLVEEKYEVVIRLRGANVDDEHFFVIKNLGAGQGMTIEPLASI